MENLLGEFIGTLVMIVFGDGVCATCGLKKSKGFGGGWISIVFGWGFAVMAGVYMAKALGAPQADLNPAITIGKTLAGVYTWNQCFVTSLAEIAGGIAGGIVVWLAYLPHWKVTDDKETKLTIFCTAPAIRNYAANFLCEFIATFFLVLGLWAMFVEQNGPFNPGFAPYVVGIFIVALGLSLGGPTGYAMNPARDLGPRIAHQILPIAGKGTSDWAYAWVPVVAPICGSIAVYIVGHHLLAMF